jgi:Kef-type K+ transport system membrane component KefB
VQPLADAVRLARMSPGTSNHRHARAALFYLGAIVVATLAFLAIRSYGEVAAAKRSTEEKDLSKSLSGIGASVAIAHEPKTRLVHDSLFHVLLAMAAVIATGRLIGFVFHRFRQPRVLGEIVAGILLGPSLLGWIAPDVQAFLLPPDVAPLLRIVADLGVILYMFLVGLELNTGHLRERGHAVIAISQAGIVVPFLLGSMLALALFGRFDSGNTGFTVFALFMGTSLSVTAFPVLARLLADHGLSRSRLGVLALGCAAVGDVTAWCLLALVVGVAQAHVDRAIWTVALGLGYTAFMLVVVRPMMARLASRYDEKTQSTEGLVAFVYVCLLLSALATERIGIHALFGAFLMGAVIPHDSRVAREFIQKLEDIVAVLLLPAFFAFTGMRTQIGLVSGWENIAWCAAIIAGTSIAGRLTGLAWPDAAAIGALMNTRGLMELIVLGVGLDLGVISHTLYAMLVLMALATTMSTAPVLRVLARYSPLAQEEA